MTCIDCNKLLYKHAIYTRAKRCRSCSKRGKLNPGFGKRSQIKKICIGCGIQITRNAKFRCSKCLGLEKRRIPPYLHYNWQGGKSFQDYPFEYYQIRDQILERDNYTCQGENCNITQKEHLEIYTSGIEVHHIDYNKKNNNKENLITLCKRCNVKANFNRNYWLNFYQSKTGRKNENYKFTSSY